MNNTISPRVTFIAGLPPRVFSTFIAVEASQHSFGSLEE